MYQELACLFWAGMWGSHESTSGHTPGGRAEVVLELCRLDIFQGLVGYLRRVQDGDPQRAMGPSRRECPL